MNTHASNSPVYIRVLVPKTLIVALFLLAFVLTRGASRRLFAQQRIAAEGAKGALSAEEVVTNLVSLNLKRERALLAYEETRKYQAHYHGAFGTRNAEMVLNMRYQAPDKKTFVIKSTTGSSVIIEKVFKKLLTAEIEAITLENRTRSALNRDNYNFYLVKYVATNGGEYELDVVPKRNSTFLYKGRLWVDATDFAVTRLEAQPVKSPSFWTKNSQIDEYYNKVGAFWLPARNHSLSEIRFAGRAELTILYYDYRIISAQAPVGK